MPARQGQICNYVGGMMPLARTAASRQRKADGRSAAIAGRAGSHEGYVAAVLLQRAVEEKFLLPGDAEALIAAAQASAVLR